MDRKLHMDVCMGEAAKGPYKEASVFKCDPWNALRNSVKGRPESFVPFLQLFGKLEITAK